MFDEQANNNKNSIENETNVYNYNNYTYMNNGNFHNKGKKNTHMYFRISFFELQQSSPENKIRTALVPEKKKFAQINLHA